MNINIDITDNGSEITIDFLVQNSGHLPSDDETKTSVDLFEYVKQVSSSLRHQKEYPTRMRSNIPPPA